MSPCAMNNSVIYKSEVPENTIHDNICNPFQEIAQVTAGYMDCMLEAVRYLVEEEKYPESHPAVLALRQHLTLYQNQLVTKALQTVRPQIR